MEILRFKYNMTPPKTGIHTHESPLQRLNIHTKYATYLNALFPSIQNTRLVEINDWKNSQQIEYLNLQRESPTKIEMKS